MENEQVEMSEAEKYYQQKNQDRKIQNVARIITVIIVFLLMTNWSEIKPWLVRQITATEVPSPAVSRHVSSGSLGMTPVP